MLSVIEIIKVIQSIEPNNNKVRFLVSLANNWYRVGQLTEKQEQAFYKAVEELKEEGYLDDEN